MAFHEMIGLGFGIAVGVAAGFGHLMIRQGLRPLLAGLAPGFRLTVVDRPHDADPRMHQKVAALGGLEALDIA